jgi:hypothetical protein
MFWLLLGIINFLFSIVLLALVSFVVSASVIVSIKILGRIEKANDKDDFKKP